MRKYLRQIAKARMKAMGMDRINRRMSPNQAQKGNVVFGWRRVIDGDLAQAAEDKQCGRKLRRKLKKVPA